ncbi:unnamed protein product [Prunus armeniaca]|uniref:Protein TIFY n=2 Tax=Prunus armeniaca TaxID=36596 RepID=A0A6J5TQ82_PRUAR|nr:hypothetical protein GBA52_002413 [Prunus armeniaca]CAB4265215.1 unnamed protein product [Prunus armeniaca]
MERDFLGLNSKESVLVVKEEISNDGCKDSGYASGAGGAHWPFLNKVSALPHLMSFKAAQDDKTKKMVSESFLSSGFMPISTADAFDHCQKQAPCEIQNYFNHDRQDGTHFSLTAYPMQHDVHSVHRPHDAKMISVTNQGFSVPVSNPFFKNHFATTGQNFAATTIKQQLQGIPVTAPYSILPVAGSTEPRNNSKNSGSPSQLTIFYAGTVNVYDDISPEKVQAMMLLAGNGSSISSNAAQPKTQAPSAKFPVEDGVPVNQPTNTPPSGLSSPLSVSSHTGVQSVSGSTNTDELMAPRTTGHPTSPVSKMEPPKIVNAVGSVAATSLIPSAVPQARKASLARFLEKRKERVMISAPYNLSKKCPDSNGVNFTQQGEQQ